MLAGNGWMWHEILNLTSLQRGGLDGSVPRCIKFYVKRVRHGLWVLVHVSVPTEVLK